LARENNVPFYVAAPVSTFDLSIPDGEHIPIEERSAAEVTQIQGVRIAPDVPAAHPAFDVTPNRYIAAIFTERGVARPPYPESLRALASSAHSASALWCALLSVSTRRAYRQAASASLRSTGELR